MPHLLRLPGDTIALDCLAMILTYGLGPNGHLVDDIASYCENLSDTLLSSSLSWDALGWLLSLVAAGKKSYTHTDGTPVVKMMTKPITEDAQMVEIKGLESGGDGEQYLRAEEGALFRTKLGMVGVGSEGMRKGDLLCALFGADIPIVLRPHENGEHLFVGDCYSYDIMLREVLNGLVQGQ